MIWHQFLGIKENVVECLRNTLSNLWWKRGLIQTTTSMVLNRKNFSIILIYRESSSIHYLPRWHHLIIIMWCSHNKLIYYLVTCQIMNRDGRLYNSIRNLPSNKTFNYISSKQYKHLKVVNSCFSNDSKLLILAWDNFVKTLFWSIYYVACYIRFVKIILHKIKRLEVCWAHSLSESLASMQNSCGLRNLSQLTCKRAHTHLISSQIRLINT